MGECVVDERAVEGLLDADLKSDLAGRTVYLVVMRVCSMLWCYIMDCTEHYGRRD